MNISYLNSLDSPTRVSIWLLRLEYCELNTIKHKIRNIWKIYFIDLSVYIRFVSLWQFRGNFWQKTKLIFFNLDIFATISFRYNWSHQSKFSIDFLLLDQKTSLGDYINCVKKKVRFSQFSWDKKWTDQKRLEFLPTFSLWKFLCGFSNHNLKRVNSFGSKFRRLNIGGSNDLKITRIEPFCRPN